MKKVNKAASLLLGISIMLTPSMTVLGQDIKPEPSNIKVISQIDKNTLSSNAIVKTIEDLNGKYRLTVTVTDKQTIVLNVSAETIFIDNETGLPSSIKDLKEGSSVYVYYNAAITKSLPPQSGAVAVLTNIQKKSPAKLIEVGKVIKGESGSIKVFSTDGNYLVTINPKTPILPYKTKQLVSINDIEVGTRLFAWFEIMTFSIPAQAGADLVVLLPSNVEKDYSKVLINNKELDLGSKKAYLKNGNIMIPLRLVAQELGFKVTWDEETSSVLLDNGTIKTTITIGKDSYFKASSKAIGLTAPFELGAAPELVDASTFVPAELFNLLFSAGETVTVSESGIIIKTN